MPAASLAPRVWSEIRDKSYMTLGFILRFGAQEGGDWFGGRRRGGLAGNGDGEVGLGMEEQGIEMRKKQPVVSPAAGYKRAVCPRAARFIRATQYPLVLPSLLNSLASS